MIFSSGHLGNASLEEILSTVSQAERRVSAKALWQEHAWNIPEALRTPVWLKSGGVT